MKKIIFFVFLLGFLIFCKISNAEEFDTSSDQVILGGETVGIKLNTGVTVSKTFAIIDGVNLLKPWKDADIRENDVIVSYNKIKIESSQDLLKAINLTKGKEVDIGILRNGNVISTKVRPVISNDSYTLGIYVKDNIIGFGTLTYVIPNSNVFGALGHKIESSNEFGGKMYEATVTGCKRGNVGEAGSKKATISTKTIGDIQKNTITGIHGVYNGGRGNQTLISVGKKEDVYKGKAQIVTCIDKRNVDYFDIEITGVLKQKEKDVKGIKFIVTDEKLLAETNGIIQGMSGSPIIQDGKLIGAVTHVLINNPHEGYGIFIEFMFSDMGVVLK